MLGPLCMSPKLKKSKLNFLLRLNTDVAQTWFLFSRHYKLWALFFQARARAGPEPKTFEARSPQNLGPFQLFSFLTNWINQKTLNIILGVVDDFWPVDFTLGARERVRMGQSRAGTGTRPSSKAWRKAHSIQAQYPILLGPKSQSSPQAF